MKFIYFSLLYLFIFVIACQPQRELTTLSDFANETWVLEQLNGEDFSDDFFTGKLPSLTFGYDKKITGFSGCNNLNGTFSLDQETFQLNPAAMTRKMCPGNGEAAFMDALNAADRLRMDGRDLVLLSGDNEVLRFFKK